MSTYLFVRDGQQGGPVKAADLVSLLQSGNLSPRDLVWTDGWDDWKPLSGIIPSLLASVRQAAPGPTHLPAGCGDDAGPFHVVGSPLDVKGARWDGICYASPRAFYLILTKPTQLAMQTMGGLLGGAVGGAISNAFGGANAMAALRSCQVGDLSPALHQTMGTAAVQIELPVVVLPREQITALEVASINNYAKIRCAGVVFGVVTRPFYSGKLKTKLQELGYSLGSISADSSSDPIEKPFEEVASATSNMKRYRILIGIIVFLLFALVATLRFLLWEGP